MATNDPVVSENGVDWQDIDWDCLRVKSPAGTWYVIREEASRKKYAATGIDGSPRAVFSRNELHVLNPYWGSLPPEARQADLGLLISIKQVLGGVVESVSKCDERKAAHKIVPEVPNGGPPQKQVRSGRRSKKGQNLPGLHAQGELGKI